MEAESLRQDPGKAKKLTERERCNKKKFVNYMLATIRILIPGEMLISDLFAGICFGTFVRVNTEKCRRSH